MPITPTGTPDVWYAIIAQDIEESLRIRAQARPAHLERVSQLRDEGRLLVAGPHPAIDADDPGAAGFSGSLIIADFGSLGEAMAWAETDPYVEAGVFKDVVVKPFKAVLP